MHYLPLSACVNEQRWHRITICTVQWKIIQIFIHPDAAACSLLPSFLSIRFGRDEMRRSNSRPKLWKVLIASWVSRVALGSRAQRILKRNYNLGGSGFESKLDLKRNFTWSNGCALSRILYLARIIRDLSWKLFCCQNWDANLKESSLPLLPTFPDCNHVAILKLALKPFWHWRRCLQPDSAAVDDWLVNKWLRHESFDLSGVIKRTNFYTLFARPLMVNWPA
jgi:hypothetical protein